MISQVVFDLPLEGPFDYLIPEHLVSKITVGTRVKVSFANRIQIGFVIGLLEESTIAKLKPVLSCEASAVFNSLDLDFARDFSAYYGCSLGDALGTMLRNKKDLKSSIQRDHEPKTILYRCPSDSYAVRIQKIIDEYRSKYKDTAGDYCRFLILVPDIFRAQALSRQLKGLESIKIGPRSAVFESDGRFDCVVMVDDEDASYKQEQTPMYETRQVLLSRSKIFGFDIAFVGVSPSVELMALAREGEIKLVEEQSIGAPAVRVVDLTNYKYVPGLISPPVRDAIDTALKVRKKSILVLNRKGSYRLTRCVDCAEILKCTHCDSSLIYSRSEGKFLCRYCTYTVPGDTVCPKCHKPSWKSVGIGVEQVQTELKKLFPLARIVSFERTARVKSDEAKQSLPDFDILISTNAVLRFQGALKAQVAAFIDFDAELNRLDMRSAFNAFSLVQHISGMAIESVFVQTRNINHYVLQNLSRAKAHGFYDEELKLRKEFGFSPFKHWVKISWRGKLEKITLEAAEGVYKELSKSIPENIAVTPPLADAIGRKRDQFRFNVMVQTDHVSQAIAFIKSTLNKLKRHSRVIMTLNIDP